MVVSLNSRLESNKEEGRDLIIEVLAAADAAEVDLVAIPRALFFFFFITREPRVE